MTHEESLDKDCVRLGRLGTIWALLPDTVWDGRRLRSGHAVVVQGSQVVGVTPAGDLPIDFCRFRVSGTAIPGLIDAHLHLADWMLPSLLAAGVTTVRDTGNRLDWILARRALTAEDPTAGPSILCTGPLLDGAYVQWPTIGRAHQHPGDMRRSVRELGGAGVDAIKLYVNLTHPQIMEASAEARAIGLPVLAHLGRSTLEEALLAGVGEIEHLSGLVHHIEGVDPASLAGAFELLTNARTILCPTLVVWDRLATMNDLVFQHDRRRRWVHPRVLRAWSQFPHRTSDAEERMRRQSSTVAMKSNLKALREIGCRIIAGSDTPWPNIVPGFGLHDELGLMVDAGLNPVEALESATVTAADALGLGDVVGRLAAGFRADIVVVGPNPLSEIRDLGDVRLVIRAGIPLSPDDLQSRVESLAMYDPSDPVTRLIVEQGLSTAST